MSKKIEDQILNSSGVRDTARILEISPNTVINHLKKKEPKSVNPHLLDKIEQEQLSRLDIELYYDFQGDEFWSYVKKKSNPRWTWYFMEKNSGIIIAYEHGTRQDNVLRELMKKVSHLPLNVCYTDDWGAYHRLIPSEYSHVTGKAHTWKIERKNLNFRTHIKRLNRKTVCFSKNEEIHDKVIGMYIERNYFKKGTFAKAG